MKTVIVKMLPIALLLSGCVGSLAGMSLQHVVINRYNDIPYDPTRHGDTRYQDYTVCVAKDNTSWTVIDACMLSKGYTVKR
jgi:hypothetical protein